MKKSFLSWTILLFITFLSAYLYVFNEWLFAITKPYFMNDLNFLRQINIFLSVSGLLTVLCFLDIVPLLLFSLLPPTQKYTAILIQLGGLLPAMIFATLILIMVDNFTYTVFKWGVVSTDGWIRGVYGLGFLVVIFLCYRRVLHTLRRLSQQERIWGI